MDEYFGVDVIFFDCFFLFCWDYIVWGYGFVVVDVVYYCVLVLVFDCLNCVVGVY